MTTAPKGIMTAPHTEHKNHVKFGEDVKEEEEEKAHPRPVSPAPKPSEDYLLSEKLWFRICIMYLYFDRYRLDSALKNFFIN
ncbi:hypothetical protein OESDEN_20349 [Oesophagostomum dentatum]|uniref:Uncharacterized protein n=1 Tax=Oesophagostomum dentatum TaxID=61180 RepID=A0A0B1S7W2_OESDE|nr:hypothetical protein OESDEN_20349 [Oesophagostomum dentatum]